MSHQVRYYDQFGESNEESILTCPEPEFWTTDYAEKGRVYKEIKLRVENQQELMRTWLDPKSTVLDIGCGFGRQAIWLARNSYSVVGTDTSPVFIRIAEKLFDKYGFRGEFICSDIINQPITGIFNQVILLDVLEHIEPSRRAKLANRVNELTGNGAILFISLPHLKNKLSSKINNHLRRGITQYIPSFREKEEHPFPIPGKQKLGKLFTPIFTLEKFIETPTTDFYIFRKN